MKGPPGIGNIETRALDTLTPSPHNAREHPPSQIKKLAASLREWGWTTPILIDETGQVLAGHGRLMAAQSIGIKEGLVRVARGWSEEKKRAYIIADNKIGENATWDKGLLALELGALHEGFGYDATLAGFSQDDLHKMLGRKDTEEDALPEVKKARTKIGSLWELGSHLLLCGDATDREAVDRITRDADPQLMVTDPPYGVNYDPSWRNGVIGYEKVSVRGHSREGTVQNDDRAYWERAWDLFDGSAAYVWHASLKSAEVQTSLEASGFAIRAQIIWVKQMAAFGRGNYHWQHEPCLYAVRKESHWQGARDQTTLWEIGSFIGHQVNNRKAEDEATPLGAQKPVECMRRPMLNNSERGAWIYDPFVGSGTTIIAAETVGRRCVAMEISPAMCDLAVARWEKFTGKKARLAD
jgi:DNA modification methylase